MRETLNGEIEVTIILLLFETLNQNPGLDSNNRRLVSFAPCFCLTIVNELPTPLFA